MQLKKTVLLSVLTVATTITTGIVSADNHQKLPDLVPQPSPQQVVDEHLDALNE